MNEINKINLSEQETFWLSEITGIKKYFHQEINQRKLCIKKLSKYATVFNYIDRIIIFLSATTDGVSIISLRALLEHQLEWQAQVYFNFFFKNRNN